MSKLAVASRLMRVIRIPSTRRIDWEYWALVATIGVLLGIIAVTFTYCLMAAAVHG